MTITHSRVWSWCQSIVVIPKKVLFTKNSVANRSKFFLRTPKVIEWIECSVSCRRSSRHLENKQVTKLFNLFNRNESTLNKPVFGSYRSPRCHNLVNLLDRPSVILISFSKGSKVALKTQDRIALHLRKHLIGNLRQKDNSYIHPEVLTEQKATVKGFE